MNYLYFADRSAGRRPLADIVAALPDGPPAAESSNGLTYSTISEKNPKGDSARAGTSGT